MYLSFQIIRTSFQGRIVSYIFENKNKELLDPNQFLNQAENCVISELKNQLLKHSSLKVNLELFAMYVKFSDTEGDRIEEKSFQTKMQTVFLANDIVKEYNKMKNQILTLMNDFQERDSGFSLIRIKHLEINMTEFNPLRG